MSIRPRHVGSRRLSLRPGTSSPAGGALARACSSAVVALLLGFVLLVVTSSRAFAHAELVGSEPSDGQVSERGVSAIRLYFSEPIEPDLFALEVYSPDRVRVDRRDARVPATSNSQLEATLGDLPPGTYTVVWRILSIDGHVVRGAFAFGVGAGASTKSPLRLDLQADAPIALSATIRWWTFMAGLVLAGGFAFPWMILRPAVRVADSSGRVAMLGARRFIWIAWAAVICLLGLGLMGLLVQAAEVTGVPLSEVLGGSAVSRLLVGTKFGALWLMRMALVAGLLVLVVLATLASGVTARVWIAGASVAAAILLTLSAGGHASAVAYAPTLAIGVDWLHMLAAAVWTGGLLQLLLVIPAVVGQPDSRAFFAALVRRFSLVAMVSVAILVGTGLYSSLVHVPSWQALQDTAYGAALTGKLLVVVPLLILGAVNLLALHPRIRRAAEQRGRRNQDTAGPFILRRLVVGEIVLVVAVLAVTGLLTGLPPATSVPTDAQPFRDIQTVGSTRVALDVSPNQAGENSIDVTLRDSSGAPIAAIGPVSLAMTHQDMDMAPREASAESVGDGQYRVRGGHLSMTGRWRVAVQARAVDGSNIETAFTPTVGPPPGANRPAFSPARILMLAIGDPSRERGSPVNLQVVAALLVALVGAWILLRVLRGDRLRRGASVAGAGAVIVGLMLFGTSVADAYWRSLPNPVPATAASIERGQAIYQANCADCHGITGRGDGLAGRFLRPRPADLRVHMAAGHTDQELFDWLSNGVAGTAMPPFGGVLSEEDRWHTVNYIRQFANTAAASDSPTPASQTPTAEPRSSPAPTDALLTSSPSATAISTPPPPSPAAITSPPPPGDGPPAPRDAWRAIGHWQNLGLITTQEFAVQGPWRIRWQLENADQRCYIMILEDLEKAPLLLTGAAGVTAGIFHQDRPGTYRLMFHNTTPYDIVVEEATPVSQRSSAWAMTTRTIDTDGLASALPLLGKMVSTTPDGPWREIGRWQSSGPATIDQFTVTSPWRIRWRLDADDEPFVAVLDPGPDGPILLEAEDGIVQGAFHVGPAGTFSLTVHTQVPWELIVEDLGAEERSISQ